MIPASRGGAWLAAGTEPAAVLTPEHLTDEHRLIRQTADHFIEQEVVPVLDRLEARDWALARALIRRSGDLGLLGVDVPEALGGVPLGMLGSVIVSESIGRCPSFATTFGAQSGLAVMPLLCFGSDEQQRRYVPRLVSGELIGAYALSEAGAGSDALSARTRATRHPDGGYVLSGEKMWITNGGFADLFILFAKVDIAAGEVAAPLTAFIVERACAGVASGREEHKMGLHGSSTTAVMLANVRLPAAARLGEIRDGHTVAFTVLNYGRLKLAATCCGGARRSIAEAARYASERRQFGRPIAQFGAIRRKLAEMVVRQYAAESVLYRTAGMIELYAGGAQQGAALVEALGSVTVEASIAKVAASEMLDLVVDETVQIHGGNGFVRDYPAERHYRDARVNRIFEGTNEINRLLIGRLLAKRQTGEALQATDGRHPQRSPAGNLAGPQHAVGTMKQIARLVLDRAVAAYGDALAAEQEVLMLAADIAIDVYASESVLLRAGAAGTTLHHAAAQLVVHEAAERVDRAAREALGAMAPGPAATAVIELRDWICSSGLNQIGLRRQLADAVVEGHRYPFQ